MFDENTIKIIITIIFLILLIGPFVWLFKMQIRSSERIDELAKNNPRFKEKIRVVKGRRDHYIKIKMFSPSSTIIYLLVAVIIAILCRVLYLDSKFMINSKITLLVIVGSIISVTILMFLAVKKSNPSTNFNINKYIRESITNKYGGFKEFDVPNPKVVYGDKTELGNIRNNYKFIFEIPKFNCIFESYNQEEMQRRYNARTNHTYYMYFEIKHVLKYYYNLNTSIQVNPNILNNEKIKKVIEELSEIKFISVSIVNNQLIVEKEAILHGYNTEDVDCDILDVELFYNELVKRIMEEV